MNDILDDIIAHKRLELQRLRAKKPSLREALLGSSTGIIAEFKRRSPSKGWIKEEGRAGEIPLVYQEAGATAVSILTDQEFFGGDDHFITEARTAGVSLPILYKNFVIDDFQVYEAALCGASALLLIAACLSIEECERLTQLAHSIGLEVLLEIHSTSELVYTELDVDCIGVNNRNLGTFHTDIQNSFQLASLLPEGRVLVSESGISNPAVIRDLRAVGYRGFLIGEAFMRAENPGQALKAFIKAVGQ
ncbi:MAG: indole-3-glycerol phosphate synthase TrpC [Bacteroidaceae bacterium]|nr:indole-3-glycerol phosphate synthase TrpC [Bacteroidaceae bacterium]